MMVVHGKEGQEEKIMKNDIVQDAFGWFYRDNGDGSFDSLSTPSGVHKVTDIRGSVKVILRNGTPTGAGDRLASRVAATLARRYQES